MSLSVADSTYWKDLVHKQDTLNDPHEWRFYDEVDERDFFDVCVHPDLMFNFWHEATWFRHTTISKDSRAQI